MDTTTPALASIGIDIGKDVFHLVAFDTAGKIAFRRKIKRLALVDTSKRCRRVSSAWKPASARTSSVASFASSVMSHGSFQRST